MTALAFACASVGCTEQPPDPAAMRAHILRQLTDEQIRELRRQSEIDFAEGVERRKKEAAEHRKKRGETTVKCQDVAYSTRYPQECAPIQMSDLTINAVPPAEASVDAIFERNLMGMCAFAKTMKNAREWKCLP